MLHQQDYILRLIEQLGRILIELRNRVLGWEGEELDQVEAQLGEWARASGMDLDLVRRLTPESVQLLVAPAGTVDPGRCWAWAEILYLDGLLTERRGQAPEARHRLASALALFRLLQPAWRPAAQVPTAGERVTELEGHLAAPGADESG